MQSHPLRFAVLFAGVDPPTRQSDRLCGDELDVPSLHIVGERDKLKRVRATSTVLRPWRSW